MFTIYTLYGIILSMNDVIISELSDQSLLLGYGLRPDGHLKDCYYHEICQRVINRGYLTGQRTHMPRHVIVDLFNRRMFQVDLDIPPDRVEGSDVIEVEWIGDDIDDWDEMFKL